MCGLVGVIRGQGLDASAADVERMASRIRYRGPDSHGIWQKDEAILGHRRLAIVDLSASGHQPMQSHDGRLAISYNGEIYNHLDIRAELHGVNWKGHSDTETLVEALAHWGTEKTLSKLNGMFAFALWDIEQKKLTLARDPFGEKPLLYALRGKGIAFASELVALLELPVVGAAVDSAALARYLRQWYVPAPLSIVEGVQKLPPGSYLEWQNGGVKTLRSYWSLSEAARRGRASPLASDSDALAELDTLLQDAVSIRKMSDVPLGALLSGGVDSSLVAALMQRSQSQPIKTFTIGFDDPEVNEAHHAEAVAKHLGTQHEVLHLREQEALDTVPQMGALYDEPFGDASQVPTYLVSKLARQHVTVVLTGDGCDELFSGYARHTLAGKAWNAIRRVPGRQFLGANIGRLPEPILTAAAAVLKPMIPAGVNPASLRRKIGYSGRLLQQRSAQDVYQTYMTSWPDPAILMVNPSAPGTVWRPEEPYLTALEDQFVWQDSIDYLPNDILVKVDRASMAVSLETRIPALDKRVAEFAWRLPQHMRWRDGKGKWILRQLLYKYVPQELVDRPKKGFAVPLDKWLRGPLLSWANDLLSPARLARQGLLRPDAVSRQWADYRAGRGPTGSQIWTLLMLQSWLEARGK